MGVRRVLGGLAAALLAGNAMAADPVPIVVPTLPGPVAVTPSGPVRGIVFETTTNLYSQSVEWLATGGIDVRLPAGFGFRLDGTFRTVHAGPGDSMQGGDLGARFYRGFGNVTVGAVAGAHFLRFVDLGIPDPIITSLGVGIDADYYGDALELAVLVGAVFDNAGTPSMAFDELLAVMDASVDIGPRAVIASVAVLGVSSMGAYLSTDTTFRYHLGPVAPFVRVTASAVGGFSAVPSFGFEFEHAVNDGRLTLVGRTELWFTGGFAYEAMAGFEYDIGDGPLTLRGSATSWAGGAYRLSVGIGAELGTGRLTGFLNPDYRL